MARDEPGRPGLAAAPDVRPRFGHGPVPQREPLGGDLCDKEVLALCRASVVECLDSATRHRPLTTSDFGIDEAMCYVMSHLFLGGGTEVRGGDALCRVMAIFPTHRRMRPRNLPRRSCRLCVETDDAGPLALGIPLVHLGRCGGVVDPPGPEGHSIARNHSLLVLPSAERSG